MLPKAKQLAEHPLGAGPSGSSGHGPAKTGWERGLLSGEITRRQGGGIAYLAVTPA